MQIFRKRAQQYTNLQRAPLCRITHLTVLSRHARCGPQTLANSPQSERSQAEGLFKSPAAYGSGFMLPHTRKGVAKSLYVRDS